MLQKMPASFHTQGSGPASIVSAGAGSPYGATSSMAPEEVSTSSPNSFTPTVRPRAMGASMPPKSQSGEAASFGGVSTASRNFFLGGLPLPVSASSTV